MATVPITAIEVAPFAARRAASRDLWRHLSALLFRLTLGWTLRHRRHLDRLPS